MRPNRSIRGAQAVGASRRCTRSSHRSRRRCRTPVAPSSRGSRVVGHLDPVDPLDALVAVHPWHHETRRASVRSRDRRAVHVEGQHHVGLSACSSVSESSYGTSVLTNRSERALGRRAGLGEQVARAGRPSSGRRSPTSPVTQWKSETCSSLGIARGRRACRSSGARPARRSGADRPPGRCSARRADV